MYYVLSRSKDITNTEADGNEIDPVHVFDNLLDATNELHEIIILHAHKKMLKLYMDDTIKKNYIDRIKEQDLIINKFDEFKDILFIRIGKYDYFIDVYEEIPDSDSDKLDSDTETI